MDAADSQADGAFVALEELCSTYWYPIYAFVRQRGNDAPTASDITQGFFEFVLEKKIIRVADRERGKFRSFLLTALKNYMSKQYRKDQQQKRGGGATHYSLQLEDADGRYVHEPSHDVTPEHLFDRAWGLTLLEQVLKQLQREYEAKKQGDRFSVLSGFLVAPDDAGSLSEAAEILKLSTNSVTVAMHRLRKRFKELYRLEVKRLMGPDDDVEEEIASLMSAAGS